MPGGDRTGPAGAGPMTGRRLGFCAGYGAPGYQNLSPRRGYWGRGRGLRGRAFGRGWRPFEGYGYGYPMDAFPAPVGRPDPEQEKQFLKDEAEALQTELESIKKRLEVLETSSQAE